MSMKLSFKTPDGEVRAVDLSDVKESLVLGRDRDVATLVIPDPQVSRAHCALRRDPKGFILEDLGSRNGTWLNGKKVASAEVKPRDKVKIGRSELTFELIGSLSGEYTDPLLGTALSGYKLEEVLGKGSYGTVYRGLQMALNRPVAIKVLDKRHQQDPERVKAFLEEARRAGRLNHPNVVQVHDVCEVDGQYFLVMELMTGGSMSDRLRIDGTLDDEDCLRILIDIGHALSYAESQRLVHRDVKPDNILVNDDGVYKLADLGIAAPIAEDGVARQVRAFGSAHYVAPEQARGGAIDGRADIYGLGATIFHLLTGRPMYEGTSREIVTAHIRQPMPDLTALAPESSPELIELITSMLSKDPAGRPGNGMAIAEAAEAIMRAPEATASLSGRQTASPRRRRRRTRRRR